MQSSRLSKRAAVGTAVVVGVLIAFAEIVGVAQRGNAVSPVVGVWRVVELTGPDGKKNTNPQPSVRIFTPRYYSIVEVEAETPRPELPPTGKRTDKQVADAFGPFRANAGTYEVKGSEISYKRIAAKEPAVMRAGNTATDTLRVEGKDTLWLTVKTSQDGPVANPTTFKLTRLE